MPIGCLARLAVEFERRAVSPLRTFLTYQAVQRPLLRVLLSPGQVDLAHFLSSFFVESGELSSGELLSQYGPNHSTREGGPI